MSSLNIDYPLHHTDVSYSGASSLNTLSVTLPRPPTDRDSDRLWVIYIHGGAWRDPEIGASSFITIQNVLLDSRIGERVAGYASINYRLSPYPSHSKYPSDPSDSARNAKHPDHINDVLTAISYLQKQYSFEDRYVLVGHSCGATLALQVAMSRHWSRSSKGASSTQLRAVPPIAIVGAEGIYDIPALVVTHRDQPVYHDFMSNAFTSDETVWSEASPTKADFDTSWPNGKLVVLAHSPQDSLVELQQPELMRQALESQGWKAEGGRFVRTFDLSGDHDEVWETGDLARAVEFAINILVE